MSDRTDQADTALDNQSHFHFDNMYMANPQQHESIILYQVGDLSCKSGYVVGDHEQFCYEISFIVSGKGSFHMDGKVYQLEEGDIVLNVPGEIHRCCADDEQPFRYFYVGFNFDSGADDEHSLNHIRKMFDQTAKRVVSNKLGIDVPFVSIFNELVNLKSYSSFMIGTYLRQLIVIAYRSFHDSWFTGYTPVAKDAGPSRMIYEVINYIDVNLHRISELTQIADELHYSYSYLSHIFPKEVGLTIKEYYNRKRFEKAVEWLRSGELNVTQIAAKLNYQSIHTFSKAFRKNFGISPTEYQSMTMTSNKVQ